MTFFKRSPLRIAICHQKNSIRWISKHVESVWNLVDRILIVDHNSTDGTTDFLKKLAEQFPTKFYWVNYPEVQFNEKVLRTWTWQVAVNWFGFPDWVIFMDGDEFLSLGLQSRLQVEFSKPPEDISYSLIETGWQHLYGDYDHQILNRRSGTILRIWNTFKLRFKKGLSRGDLLNLTFSNMMGKPEDYPFHISSYPKELRGSNYKRKILHPINHGGYFDSEMHAVKHQYHVVMAQGSTDDHKLLEDSPAVISVMDAISEAEIQHWEDYKSLKKTFIYPAIPPDYDNRDIAATRSWFQTNYGDDLSGNILFMGYDNGESIRRLNHVFSESQMFLFRKSFFPFLAFVDHSTLRKRGKRQWITLDTLNDVQYRWIFFTGDALTWMSYIQRRMTYVPERLVEIFNHTELKKLR